MYFQIRSYDTCTLFRDVFSIVQDMAGDQFQKLTFLRLAVSNT